MKRLEKRMYLLVHRSLSGIQKGIQAGHAALDYTLKYKDNSDTIFDFILNDKTWIILDGGTSQDLDEIYHILDTDYGIDVNYFKEPDLNYSTTAVCFIVDERVYDRERYPDLEKFVGDLSSNEDNYKQWVYSLGGETNVMLREFLSQFRLASN